MAPKRERPGKKALFVYVDKELHELMKERANFRHIPLAKWVVMAIWQRIEEENRYL